MSKFGFEYFVKRQEVIKEMARPSPLDSMGEVGQLTKSIMDKVVGVIGHGGEIDGEFVPGLGGNRPVNRMLRYVIYMMTKMDKNTEDQDRASEEESQSEITGMATHILGIPREGYRKKYTPDALYRAAIIKGITGDYHDYVISPEFKEKVLNPNNILNYVARNRVPNASAHGFAAKREKLHGMSAEDIDLAQTGLKDIVKKINRAEAAKRQRKIPDVEEAPKSDEQVTNDSTVNLDIIRIAIKVLIQKSNVVKQVVNTTLSKFSDVDQETLKHVLEDWAVKYRENVEVVDTLYRANVPTLQVLLASYEKLEEVGIDMPVFYKTMKRIKTTYSSDRAVVNLIDMLTYSVNQLLSKMVDPQKEQHVQEFPGYDNDIINTFLKTPEDKAKFAKYHNWLKIEKERKAQKLQNDIIALKWVEHEVPGEREWVREGFEDFQKKRPEMKTQQFGAGNEAQKALGQAPRNESYVMDYMSEQISKDRFKPIGEFKDRGFKKVKNYDQWLQVNG